MSLRAMRFLADAAPSPRGPYTHGLVAGDLLFCGAQIGTDPSTGDLPDSVAEQTAQTLRNLEAVCRAGGGRLADAARLTLYLVDLEDLAEVNDAYAGFFEDELPPRTTLGAAALVGGARICIDAIVVLP